MKVIKELTSLKETSPMSWHTPFFEWWHLMTEQDQKYYLRGDNDLFTKKFGKPNHVDIYDDAGVWIFEYKGEKFYICVNDHEGIKYGYFNYNKASYTEFTRIMQSWYLEIINKLNCNRKEKLERIING